MRRFGSEQRLPARVETALYRIVQEALTNVVRHSRATTATVTLKRGAASITATVCDDGSGFDPAAAYAGGRLGLLGMRERAEMLGGTFTVEGAPGRGATISAQLPLPSDAPQP